MTSFLIILIRWHHHQQLDQKPSTIKNLLQWSAMLCLSISQKNVQEDEQEYQIKSQAAAWPVMYDDQCTIYDYKKTWKKIQEIYIRTEGKKLLFYF